MYSATSFEFSEAEKAFDFASETVHQGTKFAIELCRLIYYVERGWFDAAVDVWPTTRDLLPDNPHPVTKRALQRGIAIHGDGLPKATLLEMQGISA